MEQGAFNAASAKMKHIRRDRTLRPQYCHPCGPYTAAEHLATHFEHIHSGNLLNKQTTSQPANPRQPLTSSSTTALADNTSALDGPFNIDIVTEAINSVPVKKAPGVDHIRGEMLRPI
ncbi:hypothetical protein EC973_002184, partial [Apophysomyces ossiformis]